MKYPPNLRFKNGNNFASYGHPFLGKKKIMQSPSRLSIWSVSGDRVTKANRNRFDVSSLPDPLTYYLMELPNLKGKGCWRQAKCCFHDDHNPSLSVNIETGCFKCFACGAKGSGIIDFHMKKYGFDFKAAAQQLGAWK